MDSPIRIDNTTTILPVELDAFFSQLEAFPSVELFVEKFIANNQKDGDMPTFVLPVIEASFLLETPLQRGFLVRFLQSELDLYVANKLAERLQAVELQRQELLKKQVEQRKRAAASSVVMPTYSPSKSPSPNDAPSSPASPSKCVQGICNGVPGCTKKPGKSSDGRYFWYCYDCGLINKQTPFRPK